MHLPDGYLSGQISVPLIGVAVSAVIYATQKLRQKFFVRAEILAGLGPSEVLRRTKEVLSAQAGQKIKKMAVVAGFIFAAQMINFPISNGTSGHLIGGVLAAIILGPWAGFIVISIILLVQSLLYADGGLIALGANIFNMGVVATIGGYYLWKFVKKLTKGQIVSICVASWLSVIMASIFAALEIGLSGTADLAGVLWSMVKIHVLIGMGEALITILVIKMLAYENK